MKQASPAPHHREEEPKIRMTASFADIRFAIEKTW